MGVVREGTLCYTHWELHSHSASSSWREIHFGLSATAHRLAMPAPSSLLCLLVHFIEFHPSFHRTVTASMFFLCVFVFTIATHSDEHRSTADCFGTPSVSITSTINHFSWQTFWLVKAGKAHGEFLTLTMAAFHSGELVPGFWFRASSLTDTSDWVTNRIEPWWTLSVQPELLLKGQHVILETGPTRLHLTESE